MRERGGLLVNSDAVLAPCGDQWRRQGAELRGTVEEVWFAP